jgi:lipoic acid synthetase
MTGIAPLQFIRGRRVKDAALARAPKPAWLKVRAPGSPNYLRLRELMRDLKLNTVCQEAHCPNIGECWHHGTATFMIMGDVCTRACGYCNVTHGAPMPLDRDEPENLARAVEQMGLAYAVVTSVDRDDLPDFGGNAFAATIRAIKARRPECRVEVLIPDFQGREGPLRAVLDARPDVLNHNTETVPRLYRMARPGGKYARALELLDRARRWAPGIPTKTGLMVGLGETMDEIVEVLQDLRQVDCQILTVGQYLRPTIAHLPMERYYTPEEFREIKRVALDLGFGHVESGPLVRSSYHAHEQAEGYDRTQAAGASAVESGPSASAGASADSSEPRRWRSDTA